MSETLCSSGKIGYETATDANASKGRMRDGLYIKGERAGRDKDGNRLKVYLCEECSKYHIGHRRQRRDDFTCAFCDENGLRKRNGIWHCPEHYRMSLEGKPLPEPIATL